jgi:RNA 3'-terminal phosphate cyclase (ATP)
MVASGPSRLELEGGTHNPFAPPYDFFTCALAPLLERMGPRLAPVIERPGFYPAGGGRITLEVQPTPSLARFELMEKGDTVSLQACSKVANLGMTIADRELSTLSTELGLEPAHLKAERVQNAAGPGNVLTVEIRSSHVTELFTGFGRREVSSAQVALSVAREVRAYLDAGAPVGPYLADQLLVPMAIGAGGRFRTGEPTGHTRTAAEIVPLFVDTSIHFEQESEQVWRVDVNVPRS